MQINSYYCIHAHIYTHTYMQREREREKEKAREREREGGREGGKEREGKKERARSRERERTTQAPPTASSVRWSGYQAPDVSSSQLRPGVSLGPGLIMSECVCVGCLFLRTPSQAPYRTPSACAKRAAYPDPPPVVPLPDRSCPGGLC